MIQLFNVILYQPLLNVLIFFYNVIPGRDVGVAIICLTIATKLILFPLSYKSIKAQKVLRDLQPKMDALKKKYQGKKEELAKAMMELYKNEKVNPMSSCLPTLIQLPFLIAIYQVFGKGLKAEALDSLYSFIHNPGPLNPISFGILDLSKPQWVLALLAGAAQYWASKMMVVQQPPKAVAKSEGAKDEGMAAMMNKQMLYMMPAFTFFIGLSLPGGLTLYWLVTTLLMVLQQYYVFSKDGRTEKK